VPVEGVLELPTASTSHATLCASNNNSSGQHEANCRNAAGTVEEEEDERELLDELLAVLIG
jgi:hypothetical protein